MWKKINWTKIVEAVVLAALVGIAEEAVKPAPRKR